MEYTMTNLVQMKIATAMKTIAGFLSLIAGRKAVIVWGQPASCGENGVISLPRPKTGEADEIALLTRQAVHEAGHDSHTDFSALAGISPELQTIFNMLEDPRIEAEQMKEFKGASLILNRGLDSTYQTILAKLDVSKEEHQSMILAVTTLTRGFLAIAPHDSIREFGPQFLAKFESALSSQMREAVQAAVARLSTCENSADVVALSQVLLSALKEPAQSEVPEEPTVPEVPNDGEKDSATPPTGGEAAGENQQGKADESHTPEAEASEHADAPGSDGADSAEPSDGAAQGSPEGANEDDGAEPDGPGSDDAASDERAQSSQGAEPESAEGPQDGQPGSPTTDKASAEGAGEPAAEETQETNAKHGDPESSPGNSGPDGQTTESDGDGQATGASAGQPGDQGQTDQPQPAKEGGGQDPAGSGAPGGIDLPVPCEEGEAGNTAHAPEDSAKPLDLASIKGLDLGMLLKQAYIDQFGQPDVDGQLEVAAEATEADEELTAHLRILMGDAEASGEPLEVVLAAIELAVAAQEAEESLGLAGTAAGTGNGTGAEVHLDLGVRLSGVLSKLVRVFTKELQDKRRRPSKYGQTGGQVAGDRVWRLKRLGDTNVFRIRRPAAGIDAAVTVLLDRSASMEHEIVAAAEVSVACAQALERISKVRTSIEMFPGYDAFVDATMTLQSFGESARQAVKRLGQINAAGGTPLAAALREVLPRLLKQRAEKHLVILVTDGNPNSIEEVQVLIAQAQAQGVEFMGIGMGEHCQIERLLPYSIHIGSTSELPDGLEKLFSGRMAERLIA